MTHGYGVEQLGVKDTLRAAPHLLNRLVVGEKCYFQMRYRSTPDAMWLQSGVLLATRVEKASRCPETCVTYQLMSGRGGRIQIEPRTRDVHSRARQRTGPPPNSGHNTSYHCPRRRIRERLSVEEIAALVASFKAGTSKWQLAEFYCMDIKSVKKLLREEG
jgi:hypothetical protein